MRTERKSRLRQYPKQKAPGPMSSVLMTKEQFEMDALFQMGHENRYADHPFAIHV